MIGSQTIDTYLARLASRQPTPGGGAAGALHAAQAAALLAMVGRFTNGPRYADHEEMTGRITGRADELMPVALRLADDDESAFGAVIAAYRLPAGSEEEKTARSQAIQGAVTAAAGPPSELIHLAAELVRMGEELAEVSNPNVISDVAAASEAARAAVATARVTLEINISAIADRGAAEALRKEVEAADRVIEAAGSLTERVREKVTG